MGSLDSSDKVLNRAPSPPLVPEADASEEEDAGVWTRTKQVLPIQAPLLRSIELVDS